MISRELRDTVRHLYDFRCGYCGVDEIAAGSELEIDHYCPQIAGGSDEVVNLVYCCPACNRIKSDYWPADVTQQLLHPLQDELETHFRVQSDGRLASLTERGAVHLRRLRLNRPQLILRRDDSEKRRCDEQELTELRAEILRISQSWAEIQAELQQLSDQFDL